MASRTAAIFMSAATTCVAWLIVSGVYAQPNTVTLPIAGYHALKPPPAAPGPKTPHAATISRKLTGRYQSGLLSGEMTTVLSCSGGGRVEVPVIDADVALGEVLLDGKPAVLQRRNKFYRLTLPADGQHELRVKFFWGDQQDHSASRVRMRLPQGGATAVSWRIDEPDVQVTLKRGVVTRSVGHKDYTVVDGQLSSNGLLDMSWTRKQQLVSDVGQGAARWSARQYVLYELDQTAMVGQAAVQVDANRGSIDRIAFKMPDDLEMTQVVGEHVLQWHHDMQRGQLLVLFRHRIDSQTHVKLHFRRAITGDDHKQLIMPWPSVGAQGALGVRAPAGLSLQIAEATAAKPLPPEKLPSALTELASKPVLLGFSFDEEPNIAVTVQRQEQVELTTTLIDELQASTVMLENGRMITKVKLRIRNNARQYLKMSLPTSAVLSHSLMDGQQLRPASLEGEMLFPLHQSERLNDKDKQVHKVRPGETLSDIANLYYSDPSQYQRIVRHNQLDERKRDLEVAQELVIPPANSQRREQSFVIEVAYEQHGELLEGIGKRSLALPSFDVDVVKVVWHVYLPMAYAPLMFEGDLTQLSHVAYDPFRRLQMFIEQAMAVRNAHAGGGKYKSVLTKRRRIYRDEAQQTRQTQALLASFPLVGRQYRFRRILSGQQNATLGVVYAKNRWLQLSRWLVFLACGAALAFALLSSRRWLSRLVLLMVMVGCLWWGHYVRHTYQAMVAAANVALIVAIAWQWRDKARSLAAALWQTPWLLFDKLRIRHAGYALFGWLTFEAMLSFTRLTSLIGLVALSLVWWRLSQGIRRGAAEHQGATAEMNHA